MVQDVPRGKASLEFEIVRLAGQRCLSEVDRRAMARLLRSPALDWDGLYATAHRHGIHQLLSWHLQSRGLREFVPAGALASFHGEFVRRAGRMLAATGQLFQVLDALAHAGVPVLPYKGPALAERLYGTLALRECYDLDLLVLSHHVGVAERVLRDLGYRPDSSLERCEPRRLRRARCSQGFRRESSLPVELHWRFTNADVGFPLDLSALRDRLEPGELAGKPILRLSNSDLLPILCVHGAKHRWARLEWLSSLAQLSRDMTGDEWSPVVDLARRTRSERTLLLGLLLGSRYAGARVPGDLLERATSHRAVRELAGMAGDLLQDARYIAESAEPSGSLRHDLFHYRLQETARGRARFVLHRTTTPSRPREWRAVTVGGYSLPVHAVVRPFRILGKLATAVLWEIRTAARARLGAVRRPIRGGRLVADRRDASGEALRGKGI